MSTSVCLAANAIGYPHGGGHLWVYLNWALGLLALGCEVSWLEGAWPGVAVADTQKMTAVLKSRLERYGLAESVALFSWTGEALPRAATEGCMDLEAAAETDLLLNMAYDIPGNVVKQFRRSALLDIDPGLLQTWMSQGHIPLTPHDVYFTIGETVSQEGGRIPDVGLRWEYTPPSVALDWWPARQAAAGAPFTTVSHWYGDEWEEDEEGAYSNDKRDGFLPYLDLPRLTTRPLELALCLASDDEDERIALLERGWRIRDAHAVASTPWDYQRYIQDSVGEFSCVKPSCIRMQNAWISDRTLCYLASGKPAVIQHTGPSRFLPDAAGLFRFGDVDEAIHCLEVVVADYDRQCKLARQLVEEHFDSRRVAQGLLERALA